MTAKATASNTTLSATVGPFADPEFDHDLLHRGKEVVRSDIETEQFLDLTGDHRHGDAVDVSQEHRLPEEVADEPEAQHARDEQHSAHRQRQSCGQRGVERRIDPSVDRRHGGDGHGRERSHGGVWADHVLP